MEFLGISMDFLGISMGFLGISMEFLGFSMGFLIADVARKSWTSSFSTLALGKKKVTGQWPGLGLG